jgi:hypothetical protein
MNRSPESTIPQETTGRLAIYPVVIVSMAGINKSIEQLLDLAVIFTKGNLVL